MDAIQKALKKLTAKEKERVREILAKLASGETQGLDIKQLRGREDVFRARKGDIRIIYRKQETAISILLIERRNDKTYSF